MTNFILYSYIFILGIVVGSFLNVCIYRFPLKLNVAKGFSFCPTCNHRLMPIDLVPVFSYIFLKGKCRYCHEPISIRYPFVELLGGCAFLIAFIRYGVSLSFLTTALLLCICIVVAYIDYDTMEILDGTHLLIGLLAIAQYFITKPSLSSILLGALIVSVPLGLIAWLSKGGIGGGDVKLMASCGLFLGTPQIVLAALIGIILGGIFAAYLLFFKKKSGKAHIALGPFLVIGVAIASLYGPQIIQWYLQLFF